MMRITATLLLLLCAAFSSLSRAAELERVAILLNEPTLKALAEPLRTYIADVEARFPVKLEVVARDWKTPQEVRTSISGLHRKDPIAGVVLIGAMPMHHFFMNGHPNPNPLYYEDFDLEFVDRNADVVDDAYKGKPGLKVWFGGRSRVAGGSFTKGHRRLQTATREPRLGLYLPIFVR